ncbi:hypothetical protein EV175_004292 [Coemansia sp. RSA 1933]|nr:hypothetical protein EV175_004292 [Coemansia sp. RSA 1933]
MFSTGYYIGRRLLLLLLLLLLLVVLAQPALAADSSSSDGGGVNISQIDLLGGIPTVLAALAALLQIMPPPLNMVHARLYRFLDWLQRSIERDFHVNLYSCTDKCHTQTYEPNRECLEKRILANIGAAGVIGCIGTDVLNVKDLVRVIQRNGNGATLVRLARLTQYPEMAALESAVCVVQFCPTYGRSVIFWQWMAMVVQYSMHWLFYGRLPRAVSHACMVVRTVWRRLFLGLAPLEPEEKRRRVSDYCMADLARHKILDQHAPWVRFALYYMLMRLAGRHLSARDSDGLCDTENANYEQCNHVFRESDDRAEDYGRKKRSKPNTSLWPNEEDKAFESPAYHHQILCRRAATDECSAARLLYAVALHSTRAMLLCATLGFVPPYVLSSSFRTVSHALQKQVVVVKHGDMDVLYRTMYRLEKEEENGRQGVGGNAAYGLVLKNLQSPLGDMVKKSCDLHFLINMTLVPLKIDDLKLCLESDPKPGLRLTPLEIDGVPVTPTMHRQMCASYLKAHERLVETMDELAKSSDSIHWGCTTWLLYLFSTAYLANVGTSSGNEVKHSKLEYPIKVRVKLKLMCALPYQLRCRIQQAASSQPESDSAMEDICELVDVVNGLNPLKEVTFCNSVPAWCLCVGHCPGICSLIVTELDLDIPVKTYKYIPYAFLINRRIKAETEAANESDSTAAGTVETIRFVCATRIDVGFSKCKQGKVVPVDQSNVDYRTLSDHLYSKECHVVVICGRDMYLIKDENASEQDDVADNEWPYPEFESSWKNNVLNCRALCLQAVKGLKPIAADPLGQMYASEATLSSGFLDYSNSVNSAKQRVLKIPHRGFETGKS